MATRRRPPLLGVSLKLYFDHEETLSWCAEVARLGREHPALLHGDVALFVLPSFQALVPAREILADCAVSLGAQDLHWEDRGAFTGEVSGMALQEVGCRYVEVGHAERRRLFGESEKIVRAKTAAALRNGLIPVICLGESEEASIEHASAMCVDQLRSALEVAEEDLQGRNIVVAYEPVWAIGAAKPASVEHITGVCGRLKEWLGQQDRISAWSVIYGGSAGPGLLSRLGPEVDGLFLGRFAHKVEALSGIIDEASVLSGGR